MASTQQMRTIRKSISLPVAYTKEEIIAQFAIELDHLSFGEELEVRRAKDRPGPTASAKSGAPAFATLVKASLVKVPVNAKGS